jgi:hypothetical protein
MDEPVAFDLDFKSDERVFHYTSAEGLYGLLTSNCLWATHFQFLNDSKEFYAAKSSLTEFIQREFHKLFAAWKVNKEYGFDNVIDLKEFARHEAIAIVNSLYKVTYENMGDPYVFSGFCCAPANPSYRNGGLLHWATYGRQGGYALRLNPHIMAKLLERESEKLSGPLYCSSKVVYSDEAPNGPLEPQYEIIADVAKAMVRGMITKDTSGVDIGRSAAPFWRVSSLLKDSYFRDEAESRIVWMRTHDKLGDKDAHKIRVRHRGGLSIPYIELFGGNLLGSLCPIEAILIGPHAEKRKRKLALETYLRSEGFRSIEVIESDVPYIG